MPEEASVNVQRALFEAVFGDGNGKRGLLRSVAVLEGKVDEAMEIAKDTNRMVRDTVVPQLNVAARYMADLPAVERDELVAQTRTHLVDDDRHVNRRAEEKAAIARMAEEKARGAARAEWWRMFLTERIVYFAFALALVLSTAYVNARLWQVQDTLDRIAPVLK